MVELASFTGGNKRTGQLPGPYFSGPFSVIRGTALLRGTCGKINIELRCYRISGINRKAQDCVLYKTKVII